MSAASSTLLTYLRALGIIVSGDGDNLVIRPASKLTPELRSRLRAAKPELLELLQTERLCQNLDAAEGWQAPAERPFFEARPRPVSEDPGRRKAMAHDILAGIAASATGDAIDPTSLDDFDPTDVAADTARLLDRQTADNQARWEAGRDARSAPDGPEDNPPPEAADTQSPSHPGQAAALDAIRQAWPKATILPAETTPASPTPGPSFDALVERLADALMVPRPWQRVTDPARARGYFEARARHMLSRARDPLAEVQREEQVASQFAAPHTASKEHAPDD